MSDLSPLLAEAKQLGFRTRIRTVRGELRVTIVGRVRRDGQAEPVMVRQALSDGARSVAAIAAATGLRFEAVAAVLDRMMIAGEVYYEQGYFLGATE